MDLKAIEKKIDALKEVSPDVRIELTEALLAVVFEAETLLERLNAIPDEAPPAGFPNPRDAFVDDLMAAAGAKVVRGLVR